MLDLPGKTRKERDASRMVRTKTADYPYGVVTGKLPDPRSVKDHLGVHDFFRQPFPRLNQTVWLFSEKEQRDRFLDVYVGEPMVNL